MSRPRALAGYCASCDLIIVFAASECFDEQYFCPSCATRVSDRARKPETLHRRHKDAADFDGLAPQAELD